MQSKALRVLLCATSLAIASVPALADTNLLTNGGFEDGNFTGWTTTGGFVEVQPNPTGGYSSHSGNYFAFLGSVSGDGTLTQSFTDTAGESLTFSFFLASNGTTPNDVNAYIDGVNVYSQTNIPAQDYTEYSFNFTGTGTDSIKIGVRDDPSFLALDDVSVSPATTPAVPEPSSLALLGTGVLGAAAAARRRFFRA